MSDRNLPEPGRAFDQWARNVDKRLSNLQRTVSKPSTTRVGECVRTFFPGGTFGTTQFWRPQIMVEFDIDPGRWLIDGELQFELHYTGGATEIGYQRTQVILRYRPIGQPQSARLDLVTFEETPLATPINLGTPQDCYFRTTVPAAKTITSETGLTITLEGQLLVEGGTIGTDAGTNFWLGPGILIATPL